MGSFWSLSQSISLLKIKQIDFKMQSVLGGAVEKAGEAVSGAIGSNKKITDMKQNTIDPTKNDFLTSDFGVKQNSHDNWLHASTGDRQGPALLEDNHGREKIMKFDHERIPERVVHARGAGAFGNFKLYESAEDVTSAGILTDKSRNTPVFVRFSTVLGSRGSADSVRDVRGFAVKFYTELLILRYATLPPRRELARDTHQSSSLSRYEQSS